MNVLSLPKWNISCNIPLERYIIVSSGIPYKELASAVGMSLPVVIAACHNMNTINLTKYRNINAAQYHMPHANCMQCSHFMAQML